MDAGLLDVLHDAADGDVAVLIAERVDVQLICAVQVLVHKHGTLRVHLYRILDVPLQVLVAARTARQRSFAIHHPSGIPRGVLVCFQNCFICASRHVQASTRAQEEERATATRLQRPGSKA